MWNAQVYMDDTTQKVFAQVDRILKAGIKPPEVYNLARRLLPDVQLERPITPEDLGDLLMKVKDKFHR